MNATILHESRGRIRFRLRQKQMTLAQADLLEAWIQGKSWCRQVTVHERTCCVILYYDGTRQAVLNEIRHFSWQEAERTTALPAHSSRALNRELKSRGIGVMAVCPFWTKTAFFDRAIKSDETPIVKKYAAMYDPDDIVARTWRDAKRGKDVCKYGFVARVQAGLTKLLPHSVVMDVWMKQQDLH